MKQKAIGQAKDWYSGHKGSAISMGIGLLGTAGYLLGRGMFMKKVRTPQHARDLMTKNPAFCKENMSLQEVAEAMVNCDCGEIPVVDNDLKPIGVVTDRDIVCRTVAKGLNPLTLTAKACMSSPARVVSEFTSLKGCEAMMKDYQIRRLPVVDKQGRLVGIISQADIARIESTKEAAELLEKISEPKVSKAAA